MAAQGFATAGQTLASVAEAAQRATMDGRVGALRQDGMGGGFGGGLAGAGMARPDGLASAGGGVQ
jgi:hypothetical protein